MQNEKAAFKQKKIRQCIKKIVFATLYIFVCFVATGQVRAQAQQRSFADHLMLDLGAQTLIPQNQPTGLGGGLGFGYEFRDFNLFLRASGMVAEPGADSRSLLIAHMRTEFRIGISPSLLALLPYIDVGSIMTRLRRPDNRGETGVIPTLYAATGLGAEILLTHELSFITRFGVAQAFFVSPPDSNNFSGPTLEFSIRYTVGRSRMLDY